MMMIRILLLIVWSVPVVAQRLAEPVTNNAVAALKKTSGTFFYSFYGLDSTKTAAGVHNKIIRYEPSTGRSSVIGRLPDLGRLASGASVINNKAYVVGGYTVFPDGKEKSSNQLFIFDPTDESITVGASLPVPIDDHVQAVWRNQLIYVISGWSDSVNVNIVQLYNPIANRWLKATALPDEPGGRVFGATGIIAGDTIYFLGGATFAKFYPPSRSFYKGVINPRNSEQIKWIKGADFPGNFRYRAAAFQVGNMLVFAGGSHDTYNYNGISYAEKKQVEPNDTFLIYDIQTGQFSLRAGESGMDLRGLTKDEEGLVYIVGGMRQRQRVTSEVTPIVVK